MKKYVEKVCINCKSSIIEDVPVAIGGIAASLIIGLYTHIKSKREEENAPELRKAKSRLTMFETDEDGRIDPSKIGKGK